MTIRRILLSLPSFPDPPPEGTLESACLLAQLLKASLTTRLAQLDSDPGTWPATVGAYPLDVRQLMAEEVVRSETQAGVLAGAITAMAAEYGVTLDLRRALTTLYEPPAALIDLARLHDLTVLPAPQSDPFGHADIHPILFGAGRPVLLLPSGGGARTLRALDRIAIAWDYSREAARALADALPLLIRARSVQLISVFGEKAIRTTAAASDLEVYLAGHGIQATTRAITLEKGGIAATLAAAARDADADLLVMGAYGHSRLSEFLLGGATAGLIAAPPLPILLSH